jgi:hypothetical protein
MAKKKRPEKKEKFFSHNENILLLIAISLPILTFLVLWYIARPETIPDQSYISYAETMDFYWTDALFQTLLIWIPIIGFFWTWTEDKNIGKGVATAIGLFIGTLLGGGLFKMFIEMALTAYYQG